MSNSQKHIHLSERFKEYLCSVLFFIAFLFHVKFKFMTSKDSVNIYENQQCSVNEFDRLFRKIMKNPMGAQYFKCIKDFNQNRTISRSNWNRKTVYVCVCACIAARCICLYVSVFIGDCVGCYAGCCQFHCFSAWVYAWNAWKSIEHST